ncbi:cutinase family protein [Mycolicibacterium porcinum]|nr:cutinase family protein [Mycolicibacterium porcinum]
MTACSGPRPDSPPPVANADTCPDAEVVFARGSGEEPGVGGIGQAFIEALRAKTRAKSVSVYPVNYPASDDFSEWGPFALSVIDGIRDASSHIAALTANCPATKIVLGGWSQGAAVASYATSAETIHVDDALGASAPSPMPPEIANHVAAVVLFGNPSNLFLSGVDLPPITIGPLYAAKTIEQCATGDTVCNGDQPEEPTEAHHSYDTNGMVDRAAQFAAERL